jgi:hypothetical protein
VLKTSEGIRAKMSVPRAHLAPARTTKPVMEK